MRLALALITLTAACGLTAVASAWVGEHARERASAATGTVVLSGPADASSLLPTRRLRAGLVRTATTTLTNGGSLPARLFVRLRGVDAADAPLLAHLTLSVQECANSACATLIGAPLLTSWTPGASVALGPSAPGAARSFQATISWPAGRDAPAAYGAVATLGLRWSARTGAGSA